MSGSNMTDNLSTGMFRRSLETSFFLSFRFEVLEFRFTNIAISQGETILRKNLQSYQSVICVLSFHLFALNTLCFPGFISYAWNSGFHLFFRSLHGVLVKLLAL